MHKKLLKQLGADLDYLKKRGPVSYRYSERRLAEVAEEVSQRAQSLKAGWKKSAEKEEKML